MIFKRVIKLCVGSRTVYKRYFLRSLFLGNYRSLGHKYNLLQNISFNDVRIQKHLNALIEPLNKSQLHMENLTEKTKAEYFKLQPLYNLMQDLEKIKQELKELDSLILELEAEKDELLISALEERKKLQVDLESCEEKILQFIVPIDIVDDKDIIMELSPGVGGQEAMLFTKDMFDMYNNYALWKGWNCEILKYDETDLGGLRAAHLSISGPNAFKTLKFECGVHRVQRVPKTEKAGRIHTSTMTVAVLPQPSEIDIVIQPKDIEISFNRSSGAGGQHVNRTDSCARIVHKATGLAVECQMERDQHRNRELAMRMLRAKLYERELKNISSETTSARKSQVGTAGRSEKVRTYNFVQDRITDHRAHINIFNIDLFFKGTDFFDELVEKLQKWNCIESLNEILNKYST